LFLKQNECEVQSRGEHVASGVIVRFFSDLPITITGISGKTRSYRGAIECRVLDGKLVLINEIPMEEYLRGLAEEPDSEPYEKQRAFAIAARTYGLYYLSSQYRKFPGMPYDGSDSPAEFQSYAGVSFEAANPRWLQAVESTKNAVLKYQGELFKPAYFSSNDGRTRSPEEIGWRNFPAAAVFQSKPDPWCTGMTLRGHGVGMSGCGALGQAKEGKTGEQILQYYYPGAEIRGL
jgi:stage II sporulation protein D